MPVIRLKQSQIDRLEHIRKQHGIDGPLYHTIDMLVTLYEGKMDKYKCSECGEECKPVEETFDYAGTHCTNGKSGTHHTGHYVSDCCGAEVELNLGGDE